MKKLNVLSKGIGLLELMLSLAIIAILLIMATRYYQSASTNQKINQAVDMFAAVKSGVRNYYVSTKTFPASVPALAQAGYLPTSYVDGDTLGTGAKSAPALTSDNVNPWSGPLNIANGTNDQFTVVMSSLPSSVCDQLTGRIQATLSTVNGESVSGDTSNSSCTVTVTYALS